MRRDFCSVTAHLVSLEHPRSGAGCRAFFHDLDGRQRLVVEAVIDEGLHQGQEDAQTVRSLQLAEQSLFRDVARRFVAPVCVRLHYGLQTQDRSAAGRALKSLVARSQAPAHGARRAHRAARLRAHRAARLRAHRAARLRSHRAARQHPAVVVTIRAAALAAILL